MQRESPWSLLLLQYRVEVHVGKETGNAGNALSVLGFDVRVSLVVKHDGQIVKDVKNWHGISNQDFLTNLDFLISKFYSILYLCNR